MTRWTVEQMFDGFSAGHNFYDGINNIDRRVNTMFYNNGTIYTNYWYTWVGTNKKTGEKLTAKGHAYFQWKDGKIIEITMHLTQLNMLKFLTGLKNS